MGGTYRLVRGLLRLGLKAYFREIEVRGLERLEAPGPCVLVANHQNSMIDPFLIIAAVDRPVCFIAKAPLFRQPVLGSVLRALRCIPAHRSQDPGYAKEKNDELYEKAAGTLAAGPVLAIFPEGKSHSEPELAEFKHGAAKIALEAEQRRGGARILLAGLHFLRSRGFRGRVLVEIGAPVVLEAYRERYAKDAREAVAALTAELHERLTELLRTAESHEVLRLAGLLARMRALEVGGPDPLPEAVDREKRILDACRALKASAPAEVEALHVDLKRYEDRLRLLGVRDDQVAADYRFGRVAGYVLRNLVLLLLGLPFVAAGLAANAVPYVLAWCVSRLFSGGPDQRATAGFLSALVLFPAAWAAIGWAAWGRGGGPALAAALALAPLAGLAALHGMDRWHRVFAETRGLAAAIALPAARATLRRLRRRCLDRARRLMT